MEKPIENYWQIRLNEVKGSLEGNNFEVFIAENVAQAKKIVLEEIFPKTGAKSVSWGGSMTFLATGLYEAVKGIPGLEVLDTYDKSLTPEQSYELRRKSLLVDLFFTGSNAVTEGGMLVNLDMIGNRVGGLTFGPRHVVVLVGRNKIVSDLDEAMMRIKNYAAPTNAMRLDKKTPCVKTSYCEECKSPERICNTWAMTEKSFPKGRVKVILINQDLGL
jgi:hypothetical protein